MSARKKYAVLFPALLLIAILAILLGGQWPGYCSRSAQGLTRTESYSRSARGLTRTGEFFEASEEFLVNDDFSIADQGYPDIAVDAVGNFRIVWQDNRESNYSVYEQYFAWDGERLGPNTPVNDDANGDEQYDPHIGMSVNGYTKIVWQDYRAAGYPTNPDIYAQDIDENGSAVGANARVNSDFGQAQQRKPNLDMSPSGAAVVVWEDYRNNNWDIYAQWYSNTGTKVGSNIKINDDATGAIQHRPFSAADGLGNTLICWYDDRNGTDDVFGQIYDASRTKVGGNFLITDPTAASVQKFPAAAGLPGGGFVVVWNDYRNGPYPSDPDVYAQRITAAGQKIGTNFRVNDDGPGTNQTEPQIGSAPTNGFVICWRQEQSGSADIYARRYDPSGAAVGASFMVNDADAGALQSSPAVAMSDAKMHFTWTDNRNSGLFDIYGRIITYDNPRISIIPSFILLEAEEGQPNPPNQQVTVTNTGAGVLEWAATDNASWLSFTPSSGTAPTTVTLQANTAGMGQGDYTATVTFTDQNDPQVAGVLAVSLTIEGKPIISVNPSSLAFEAGLVGPPPAAKQLTITNTGGKTLNWQSTVSHSWLALTPVSGTAPSTSFVSVNPAGLAAGTYQGAVSILDSTAYNPRVDVPVTLEVVDNSPVIELSDTAVHFTAYEQRTSPPPQEVLVSNAGEGALNFRIDSLSAGWLSVHPLAGLAPRQVSFTAVTDTLRPGYYRDTLWFVDTLASNSPVALPVAVQVEAVPPEIHLSRTTMSFSAMRGGSNPPQQTFDVTNTGGSTLRWSIAYHASWLAVDPDTGVNQQTVTCNVDHAGVSSGNYADTIRVSDPAAANSPQSVIVNLAIGEPDTLVIAEASADPARAAVVPISLVNIDSIIDISIPLRYNREHLRLDSAGFGNGRVAGWASTSVLADTVAGRLTFLATAHAVPVADNPLAPGSGAVGMLYFTVRPTAPVGARLAVDTATHAMSPFSLTEVRGTAFAPRVVSGGVRVTLPPRIQASPGRLDFVAIRAQNAPPAQYFTVSNSGGGRLQWAAACDGNWVTVDPATGSDNQTVACRILLSRLSSGAFSNIVTVSDPDAANSPQTLRVNAAIDEPDTVVIARVNTEPGGGAIVPVILRNREFIRAVSIPLVVNPTYVDLDSASVIGGRLAGWTTKSAVTRKASGTVIFSGNSSTVPLAPGKGVIGHLFLHIKPHISAGTVVDIDTATVGAASLSCTDSGSVSFVPRVVAGQVQVSDPLGITTEEQDSQDDELGIANYPNPFNFATVIHISGDADSPMHLAVYDILGRLVRDLSAELNRHGTPSRVAWDGADQNGAALGSGVYFALLRTAHARVTHKILLLR